MVLVFKFYSLLFIHYSSLLKLLSRTYIDNTVRAKAPDFFFIYRFPGFSILLALSSLRRRSDDLWQVGGTFNFTIFHKFFSICSFYIKCPTSYAICFSLSYPDNISCQSIEEVDRNHAIYTWSTPSPRPYRSTHKSE